MGGDTGGGSVSLPVIEECSISKSEPVEPLSEVLSFYYLKNTFKMNNGVCLFSVICQSVKNSACIKSIDFTGCSLTWRGTEHTASILKVKQLCIKFIWSLITGSPWLTTGVRTRIYMVS